MRNNVKNVIAIMVAAIIVMNDLRGNLWDMQSVAEAASVKKIEQSIEGPFAYNLVWDSTDGSGILKCSAMTKINYSVLEGSDYTTINGARITMSQRGNAVILATAAESAIYKSTAAVIVVSCTDEPYINDIGDLSCEFSGKGQPYTFAGSSGFSDYRLEYSKMSADKVDWSETMPKEVGDYFVKINLVVEDGREIIKFSTMRILPRQLSIEGFGVSTKVFDESVSASLEGKLTGVLKNRNSVTLQMPKIAFCDANAGKNKKVKVLSGKLGLAGNDASDYRLKSYDVSKLTGTILDKEAIITADDKYSTEGYDAAELTFTCTPHVNGLEGVKLSCPITKSTPAGKYKIKVSGAKAPNYKFTYVYGVYTVYENTAGDDSPDNGIVDDWDSNNNGDGNNGQNGLNGSPSDSNSDNNSESSDNSNNWGTGWNSKDNHEKEEDSVFAPHAASVSVKFSGVNAEVKTDGSTIMLDRVYSNTGKVSSTGSGYEMKIKGSPWSTVLNIMDLYNCEMSPEAISESKNGKCKVISNLKVSIRNQLKPELHGTMVIKKYIIDLETPLIQVDGVNLVDGRTSEITRKESKPLEITVSALYGLTGRAVLAYRLVGATDTVDVSDSCWKNISGEKIVLSQDFEGQVAIKAVDALGNYSIVYTEAFRVDASAPKISGISSGRAYNGSVTYKVEDLSGVQSVTIDGKEAETAGSVTKKGLHTLRAIDVYGNAREVTFEVKADGLLSSFKNWLSRK